MPESLGQNGTEYPTQLSGGRSPGLVIRQLRVGTHALEGCTLAPERNSAELLTRGWTPGGVKPGAHTPSCTPISVPRGDGGNPPRGSAGAHRTGGGSLRLGASVPLSPRVPGDIRENRGV